MTRHKLTIANLKRYVEFACGLPGFEMQPLQRFEAFCRAQGLAPGNWVPDFLTLMRDVRRGHPTQLTKAERNWLEDEALQIAIATADELEQMKTATQQLLRGLDHLRDHV